MQRDTEIRLNREHIIERIQNGERLDGRGLTEFRPIELETGFIRETAEGSARVRIGNTEVVVGIKADIGEPYPDAPDAGTLITNAEEVPIADDDWEPGPPSVNAVEVSRVVDRGLRESGTMELTDLGIVDEEKCWLIFIDGHILDYDGNFIDVFFLGAVAALMSGKLPVYDVEEDELDRETHEDPIPISDFPVTLTGWKIGGEIVVDPTAEEVDCAEARLTVTLDENDNVVSLQKGGSAEMSHDETMQVIRLTEEYAEMLRETVRDALSA